MLVPASVSDYRLLARRRLPKAFFDYIDGGAYNELTLAANRNDLDALKLHQRVLRGASNIDTSTTVLGEQLAQPVILGPVGLAGLFARRGPLWEVPKVERRVHRQRERLQAATAGQFERGRDRAHQPEPIVVLVDGELERDRRNDPVVFVILRKGRRLVLAQKRRFRLPNVRKIQPHQNDHYSMCGPSDTVTQGFGMYNCSNKLTA